MYSKKILKSYSTLRYLLIFITLVSCNNQVKYQQTNLTFEERVDDLVSRMTLEEKSSLLVFNSPEIARLNIPEYNWWNECLHGVGRSGIATVFPQAIGMAAMWDDSTLYNIANTISDEARAKYNDYIKKGKRGIYHGLTFWSPNINIFRDPRWGRGMETYGEDPYLTGQMGVAFIKGLQGNDPKYFKLIATPKHFVVHSGPESTRHSFNATPNQYDFLETYTPHFKKAIQEGNAYSVMCAYNRYQGTPCCGNIELATILRKDWGFKGYIVSDCWAIADFYTPNAHEIVNTKAEAASLAIKAGTDLNCGVSYSALPDAVKKGYVTEDYINTAVKRLLLARMKLGMFDPDNIVPYSSIPYSVVDSDNHKKLALDAARKSIVLLENKKNILPFSKNIKKVAVIGPNANDVDVLLGNYNGYPSSPITPYEGIKQKLKTAEVVYAQGCRLANELPLLTTIPEDVLFSDSTLSNSGLKGEYFNNTNFSGKAQLSRNDKKIDFKWWTSGPGAKINPDTFSVRWTGFIVPKVSGNYAIGAEAYPKLNLMVEGLDTGEWNSEHHPGKQYDFVNLEAGKAYRVKLEYVQEKTEYPNIRLLWEQPGKKLKDEALKLASGADLVVLCMGLSPMLEGEEMKVKVKGFAGGDRVDIKLPEIQTELIKEIQKLGKPTVLVLLNGSALAFNWEAQNIPAIIEAWYPGQAGGAAIADVIFGDYNPSGRLPVTFYKSVDQLPDFDNYNMDGRTYRYFSGQPLYEFGYGLSYSNFNYTNLSMTDDIEAGKEFKIEVEVSNNGRMDGEEVVELYLAHPNSQYKVAIRSLKRFKRIFIKKGESKKLEFVLKAEDVAVLDANNRYVVAPGELLISIGGRQPDKKSLEMGTVIQKSVQIKSKDNKAFVIQ